jgi:hypothetical protein
MEDPTLGEMIRGLRADVQRLIDREALYVTQEQRATDKELSELKIHAVASDQKEDRARLDNMARLVWSAFIGPVIVGVVLYFLLGGKP